MVRGPEQSHWEHPNVVCLPFQHRRGKSLGHCPQHLLHVRKMNINQTWGMAELRNQVSIVSVHWWWEMFRKFSGDLCCVRGKHLLRKHADTELQDHTTGPTHGPPTPIHTKPQHLNDVDASRYHRIKTLFFPERWVSCMHLQPAAQVGIQHQGHSPTRASQRTPALSDGLYLSRVLIPEYLPYSFASQNSCDWREGNRVRCQHLEPPALSFLSYGLSPQITTTLYSADSKVQQSVLLESLFHIRPLNFNVSNNNTLLFKKENFQKK